MSISKNSFRAFAALTLLLLAVVPLAAAERAIYRGTDLWSTPGDGSTFIDFKLHPIPSGFFCAGSEPFDGRIVFKGAALETDRPGQLRNVDTIVERLDDAPFNKRGVASTRLQVRALSLVGTLPVKTSCGVFGVKVLLSGDQPITSMRIVRQTPTSGYYIAPLALNANLVFTPVRRGGGAPLVLRQEVRFESNPEAPWTTANPAGANAPEKWAMNVDTDGDGSADTIVLGTSNFSAGRGATTKVYTRCHGAFDPNYPAKQHCTTLCDGCAEP